MNGQRPGGTVYGRGGADAGHPARGGGLHPAVRALAVSAALVAVLAAGYWFLRDPGSTPQVGSTSAAAPITSSAAAAPEAPSPEASPTPERLRTGTWLLVLADDPGTHLSIDGEFAAMTSADPAVLDVVTGLADDACFSFRAPGGRYLRHFDYRLRFDASDDSELFRNDATFCPDGARLRSKNYPEHVLHQRGSEVYIDEPDDTDTFAKESSFAVQAPPTS